MMEQAEESYLEQIYFSLSHPASFSGLDKLQKAIKSEGKYNINRIQLKKWLSQQHGYTSHRGVKRRFKRPRVIVSAKDQQFDGDTVNMVQYGKENKGFKYILVLIDIFTRFLWTYPLKTLKAVEMVTAMKEVFSVITPEKLRTDNGSEFVNKTVEEYLNSKDVKHFTTRNETKSNFAERVIRTVKSKITHYMTHKQSHEWVSILQDVTKSYNTTFHRSIKMTPAKAREADRITLWKVQYETVDNPLRNLKSDKSEIRTYTLKVGDQVKISFLKKAFERAYDEKWSREVFIITGRVMKQNIAQYTIKSWDNDPVIGRFYQEELQKVHVDNSTIYNIEKVVRKKRKRKKVLCLVKWQGWGEQYNTWVPESEIQDI